MNSEQLDTIGKRLRWSRQQAGLTQAQVADEFDWHRPTVSQIEADQRAVKSEEVHVFAELYDVKQDWLVSGDSALESNPALEVAARELSKLSEEDLGTLLRVIRVLKASDEE